MVLLESEKENKIACPNSCRLRLSATLDEILLLSENYDIFIAITFIIIIMKSKLKCPKCGYEFEYKWIPLASLTSISLGKKRYMRCPKCHKWSWFNVWDTRISSKK